jgi:hypothetical protein
MRTECMISGRCRWTAGPSSLACTARVPYGFLVHMGYGGDILTSALIPFPPLDHIMTVRDRILTRSGMCP